MPGRKNSLLVRTETVGSPGKVGSRKKVCSFGNFPRSAFPFFSLPLSPTGANCDQKQEARAEVETVRRYNNGGRGGDQTLIGTLKTRRKVKNLEWIAERKMNRLVSPPPQNFMIQFSIWTCNFRNFRTVKCSEC